MTNYNEEYAKIAESRKYEKMKTSYELLELKAFRDYQKHIADTLSKLKSFSSPFEFLEVENKKSCEDFFSVIYSFFTIVSETIVFQI